MKDALDSVAGVLLTSSPCNRDIPWPRDRIIAARDVGWMSVR
jgi:hypothetical protein